MPAGASVQTTGQQQPSLVIASMYGRDLFAAYCAPCHGHDGRGNGPVAHALKTVPSDLTVLASNNGGIFPRQRITAILNGEREVNPTAHGSTDMPVWGPLFGGLSADQAANRIRLANIVDYLASMQKPE